MSDLQALEAKAQKMARTIDTALGNVPGAKRVGFMLLLFDFGPEGFATYVSNGERADMRRALVEMLGRMGGMEPDELAAAHRQLEPVVMAGGSGAMFTRRQMVALRQLLAVTEWSAE